jgi:hypothetical protein
MIEPAWDIAEEACKKRLEKTDGSIEAGMRRVGEERFESWVLNVEEALESVNPKEK